MTLLRLLHRWTGGILGLVLALLGLSGAILVHRDALVMLPHAGDAHVSDGAAIAAATAKMMADPAHRPQSILYASDSFGLNRLSFGKGAGAYADQTGEIVTRWHSQWERPEIWLFDFHHHLFAGDTGETIAGIAGLFGLFFVLSGIILWWRTRKTFRFRLLPRRLTASAIVRHHRDLGLIAAPVLALALFTGSAMIFRPVASLILGPGFGAEMARSLKPPPATGAKLADELDWKAIILAAQARFPEAELRSIGLPRKDSGLISIRMRQPEEWAPNGRTNLWFAADTGALVAVRDARTLSPRVWAYTTFYPLHAGAVGGMAYKLLMTAAGLALALLGSLAVWSFWFRRDRGGAAGVKGETLEPADK
ncbi:MAG TPA: PepSY-associated TM helix domain-containing protein [Sphingobium sp.]|nr:PepSY-associated TM helix domain-containing protein [Sphingobium sp.]